MAFSVGELVAFLKLDTSQYETAMRGVQSSAASVGQAIDRGLASGTQSAASYTAAAARAQAATASLAQGTGQAASATQQATNATQQNTTANTANAASQRQRSQQGNDVASAQAALARTMDQSTGAVTANTRAMVANQIGPEKLRALEQLGVSTRDYVDAAVGVPGAEAQVRAALAASTGPADALTRALADLNTVTQNVSQASSNVATTARAAGTAQAQAAAGAQANAQATAASAQSAGTASDAFGKLKEILAGAVVVSYLTDAITASSDLNETISKSGQIFGDSSAAIEEWGQTAAQSVGLSRGEAIGAAANFGNMFTQIGYTGDAAAELSMKVVQMSADLGSFNNLPTADVADKIAGAFNGEYDSISALIPGLNAARVETEALTATGKASADQLTAQEKVTATLAIISKDGAKAMGDFARTSDGFANQSKITAATIEDQKAALGDKLMPVMQTFMGILNDVGIPALGALGDGFASLATFLGPVITFLGNALVAFTDLPGGIQAVALALGAVVVFSGPLTAMWASITAGAATARASMIGAAAGATGLGAASAIGAAGVTRLGLALKTAFLSNPIGIALVGITTAFALFSSSTEEATPPVTDFTAAINESTGALNDNAQAVLAKSLADSGSINNMQAIGVAADTYVRALMGEKAALDEVNAAIAAGTTSYATAEYGELTTTTDEAAAAARTLAADQGGLASAQDTARDAAEGAGTATESLSGALDDQADAAKRAEDGSLLASDAVGAQEAANKDLETAIRNVIAALDDQQHRNDPTSQYAAEAAIRDTVAAMREGAAATRDIDAANADYQQSIADVSAAEAELAELQKSGTATSAQLAEGQRSLDEAHRGVADAADSVREAEDKAAGSAASLYEAGEDVRKNFIQLAQEAYNAAAATGTQEDAQAAAKSTVESLTSSLYNQMIQNGKTDDEARAYINSLGLIPADVATQVSLNGIDAVNAEIAGLQKKFAEINATDVSATVRVTQTISTIGNALPGIVGSLFRAGGGEVRGPGTATSDSIPAMLSDGEHVLTAREVEAAGGQGSVYAIRRAILAGSLSGYASGGAVTARPNLAPTVATASFAGGGAVRAGNSYQINVNHYGNGEVAPQAVVRALREAERVGLY